MELPQRYDFRTAEPRLQQRWADQKTYEFDPAQPGPLFTVDTPPPTVSGQTHIGHVFSFTQADIAIRYHRMRGESIFYPFGFDDNGLPTERFTEQSRGITARDVGRDAFIRACLELSAQVEERFERFWKRLGLSVDWRLRYSTIDDRSRRIAQHGFLDLYAKGLIERRNAPTLWCPECQTAVAQADVEDKDLPTAFVTLAFPTTDGREIRIATTRPELLPACVAVFVHPDDPRYADLIGATACVPLFDLEVPILANADAQRDKGTGAVMCCTFGDHSDVRWWYEQQLPLRLAITPSGRMSDLAGPYAGLHIRQARARILDDLQADGLILERQTLIHAVGVHERCGTEIEYLVAGQWFVSLLPHKERFLEAGKQIAWYPDYMHARYESWVKGLTWDWAISRQRYFGVPFPLWYCDVCGAVTLANAADLPLDPTTSQPAESCSSCGNASFRPETDVMDTWATSSLTPQICASLYAEQVATAPTASLPAFQSPMSLRPNAHDIIRTWDFYTIVQSLAHTGRIPWNNVMIAGHAQDPSGKKISKSKLKEAQDPTATIEEFSADAVRYWTAGVRTGSDTSLSEDAFRQGNRLATKLWNAARFVLSHNPDHTIEAYSFADSTAPSSTPTDRWLLSHLGQTIARATAALDAYELFTARTVMERFFWSDLCDIYLELVKFRLHSASNQPHAEAQSRAAAVSSLRQTLLAVLKLLAPFLPHITEEIYLIGFAEHEGVSSIHLAPWPDAAAYPQDPIAENAGAAMLEIVEAVRQWKSERHLSVGAAINSLTITCPPDLAPLLEAMTLDLRSITRAQQLSVQEGEALAVLIDH